MLCLQCTLFLKLLHHILNGSFAKYAASRWCEGAYCDRALSNFLIQVQVTLDLLRESRTRPTFCSVRQYTFQAVVGAFCRQHTKLLVVYAVLWMITHAAVAPQRMAPCRNTIISPQSTATPRTALALQNIKVVISSIGATRQRVWANGTSMSPGSPPAAQPLITPTV